MKHKLKTTRVSGSLTITVYLYRKRLDYCRPLLIIVYRRRADHKFFRLWSLVEADSQYLETMIKITALRGNQDCVLLPSLVYCQLWEGAKPPIVDNLEMKFP